jgi:hypothetical protein
MAAQCMHAKVSDIVGTTKHQCIKHALWGGTNCTVEGRARVVRQSQVAHPLPRTHLWGPQERQCEAPACCWTSCTAPVASYWAALHQGPMDMSAQPACMLSTAQH